MGMRFSVSPFSLTGVLSPTVRKLSLLELLGELGVLLLLSGLAWVNGRSPLGLLNSASESLLLLLLLLSELLSLLLLLDELSGLYLFSFSLIFGSKVSLESVCLQFASVTG